MGDKVKRRRSRKSSGVEGIEGSLLASQSKKKRTVHVKTDQAPTINCFKEVRVEYPIHLPPSCIGSPLPGVIKLLGDHLMK